MGTHAEELRLDIASDRQELAQTIEAVVDRVSPGRILERREMGVPLKGQAVLFRAAQGSQASQAGGMQEALAWLTSPWDVIVAIGLGLFGLFSLVEARYRVIHDVPVDEMAHKARGTASRLT